MLAGGQVLRRKQRDRSDLVAGSPRAATCERLKRQQHQDHACRCPDEMPPVRAGVGSKSHRRVAISERINQMSLVLSRLAGIESTRLEKCFPVYIDISAVRIPLWNDVKRYEVAHFLIIGGIDIREHCVGIVRR